MRSVLDHGFVRVVDVMPSVGGDEAIVQAARVSYGEGTTTRRNDEGLIRYLMRHEHWTPFEMGEVKLHCKMPLFVARQWVRHRTANINEYSGRYSEIKEEFYIPSPDRIRGGGSSTNKQGSGASLPAETQHAFLAMLRESNAVAFKAYQTALDAGVAREIARIVLPLNTYTEWYWKCDLRNLLHFLKLRMDRHAQWEIQEYARAIFEEVEPHFPVTFKAFRDFHLDAVRLSGPEFRALSKNQPLDTDNKSEEREYLQKIPWAATHD